MHVHNQLYLDIPISAIYCQVSIIFDHIYFIIKEHFLRLCRVAFSAWELSLLKYNSLGVVFFTMPGFCQCVLFLCPYAVLIFVLCSVLTSCNGNFPSGWLRVIHPKLSCIYKELMSPHTRNQPHIHHQWSKPYKFSLSFLFPSSRSQIFILY